MYCDGSEVMDGEDGENYVNFSVACGLFGCWEKRAWNRRGAGW